MKVYYNCLNLIEEMYVIVLCELYQVSYLIGKMKKINVSLDFIGVVDEKLVIILLSDDCYFLVLVFKMLMEIVKLVFVLERLYLFNI